MKRSYFLMAGFLAVLTLAVAIPAHAVDPDTLYVRYIDGAVGLSEAGSPEVMQAVVNTPLVEGDTVAAGPNGRAELFLKDGSMVRVGNNSVMRIAGVNDRGAQFTVQQGTAYVVSRGSREVPIFLNTPLTALDISSPSVVRIDVYSNGMNEISVLKGGIYASQRSGRMLVRQGERLVLKADGSMPVVAALRAPDEWLRWNTDRDAMALANTGSGDSYAYLPDELRTYSSDLDANGQWIYTPEYDYVWVPTVIVAGAWSPYRYGRWSWIGGSYVWIGYEPWGWVPYHYGRWVNYGRAGWCWVPPRHRDVRWEPAQVAWVHSSRQIGWVPLAPGEHYDRRTAPVVHQATALNVPYNNVTIERSAAAARASYRNASVANSMVTVERDRVLGQRTMNVAGANKGAPALTRVSLAANVTPARTTLSTAGLGAASPSRPSVAPLRMSGTGSKDITGTGTNTPLAPVSRPEVATRQLTGMSLGSRVENARNPALGAARSDPVKANAPGAQKGPAPAHAPTVTPLRERIQAVNSPAVTPGTKSDSEPKGPKNEMNAPRTAFTSPAPATPVRKPETNQAAARTSPAREPVPAVRANSVSPAPSANRAARPAFAGKQPSPVVSVNVPRPSSTPTVTRQAVVRSEPARGPAPQVGRQARTAPSGPARIATPAPARTPAPQAAAPPGPAPAPAARNDNKGGQAKNNNRPHT